ncbi:inosine-uridine preferring nucleoside hydrolase-like [Culex pipiens pallens]|uniref:inosine-uridine preferring nucleoside hydrolase-like n=1 Tax=Culex pipiens pallens TaxID=42434 RepID=UPI001954A556|nr:inosine-uridine preferring nucleoside hydrolase-like [Culex pipiens pallens]
MAAPPTSNGSARRRRRVIVDVDVGTDDAWALLLLLKCERKYNFSVEAITCTHGNTDVHNATRNVVRILGAIGRTDVPVYRGAEEPLATPILERERHFHGVDGFGDLNFPDVVDEGLIRAEHAVNELYRRIAGDPGEISLIFVGPLTNLALCLKMYPKVSGMIKDLYIMGGNRNGVGNVTKSAEFNFWADPEAAHVVLNTVQCPITVLPWETCITQHQSLPMSWRMDVVGNTKNRAVQMLNQVETKCYSHWDKWMPCDAFLAAVFICPEIVEHSEQFHVDIELTGRLTRGQMVLDHLKKGKDTTRIVDRIDCEKFKLLMLYSADHDVEAKL